MLSPSSTEITGVRRARRWLWFALGWVAVGVGSIGIVVPGLPTTVFFIVAASCFARSSPRFEQWVLDLPRIGALVRDHRAGLGMARRSKVWAIATMVVFATVGVLLGVDHPALVLVIVALVTVGAAYITFRVPTRELVLARREASAS
ncbi:MAG: YbaN family protein [Actinomycetota bacterium]